MTVFILLIAPASALTTTFTWEQGTGADYLNVYFEGTVGSGTVTSWGWDFDSDGIIDSTKQNPVYSFPIVDTYTVSLTTTFDTGYKESSVKNIVMVEPVPEACFSASATSGDAPLVVTFTDLTLGVHDTSWNFDDMSNRVSIRNPTHNFTTPGTYWVVLTVTGINGDNHEYSKEIVVNYPKPVALFTVDERSGKPPLSVQFTDQSTISYGAITGWYWTFGDDTSSNERNPEHEYSEFGNYTVTLKVTSDHSKTNTYIKTGYISVENPVTATTTTPTPTTTEPTPEITETPEVTEPTPEQEEGAKIFGIPGTEFFRNETVKFHGLYKEWMLIIKGLFGMS